MVLSLEDLPASVRSGLTTIRLTCIDAASAFSLDLDVIAAVREELLADVDASLVNRLNGRLELNGTAVPDWVGHLFEGLDRLTETGFALRPPAVAYDLLYEIDAVAEDRADAAAMLHLVLSEFGAVSTLEVSTNPLTVEWVDAPVTEVPPGDRPLVHLKVSASQRPAAPTVRAVPPFNRIDVEVDDRASA